mmetsp:Transcript_61252/g.158962  ORF Transcript_61252/g.158962 Transcript_61252/m.158962 type:complete len:296 (-) Transcript_61252:266-1153(-)
MQAGDLSEVPGLRGAVEAGDLAHALLSQEGELATAAFQLGRDRLESREVHVRGVEPALRPLQNGGVVAHEGLPEVLFCKRFWATCEVLRNNLQRLQTLPLRQHTHVPPVVLLETPKELPGALLRDGLAGGRHHVEHEVPHGDSAQDPVLCERGLHHGPHRIPLRGASAARAKARQSREHPPLGQPRVPLGHALLRDAHGEGVRPALPLEGRQGFELRQAALQPEPHEVEALADAAAHRLPSSLVGLNHLRLAPHPHRRFRRAPGRSRLRVRVHELLRRRGPLPVARRSPASWARR